MKKALPLYDAKQYMKNPSVAVWHVRTNATKKAFAQVLILFQSI